MAQTMESQRENEKEGESTSGAQDAVRREVEKKAKAAVKRGILFVLNFIAGAVDASVGGLTFVVDLFLYIFSFGWLNLEMIYGTHLAKGKSKIISPLSWDPIPMPVDPKAHWLQAFIVSADIALVVAIVFVSAFGTCFLYDYVQLISHPIQTGISLAQGGEGMCLGGIMSLVFSWL